MRRIDQRLQRAAQRNLEQPVKLCNRLPLWTPLAFHAKRRVQQMPRFSQQPQTWQLPQQETHHRLQRLSSQDLSRFASMIQRHVEHGIAAQPRKEIGQ